MAGAVCSPLKPIASYKVGWQPGGYQVLESANQEQADPYWDKLVRTCLSNLKDKDYVYVQSEHCLARADGVLLAIKRQPDQDRAKADQAGSTYTYDIDLYKWPRLGWVWTTCLLLAILAVVVSALGLALQLGSPALDPQLPEKYKELQKQHDKLKQDYKNLASRLGSLRESYEKAQDIAPKFSERAKSAKNSGETVMVFNTKEGLKLSEFLDECTKQFGENLKAQQKHGEKR